ncbi:MAG: HAMP domain-containing protein [Clostridia bacterium]|nr:HAMP domain-containing protein [Clostridia bacterium]MBR6006733.1 HAMP domain-containing protein [Clostridia bacterium]
MRRSSLLRIILFIISAMMILIIAFIAVTFSIIGQDMYVDYKAEELLPKAQSISQQVSQLYASNADRRTIARKVYSGEFSVPEASTYIFEKDGVPITTDSPDEITAAEPFVRAGFERIISGDTITDSRSAIGVMVGVPIYGNDNSVIGAVLLIHRTENVQHRVNKLTLNFGIMMLIVLVCTLVPSVLIFRSVTKPIKKISDTAIEMSKGDLSARAEVRGSFEAQHLAESFNVLAGALQSNIDDLIIERNRLGTVLNGIGEGIIAVDRKGSITHYNSSSVNLLGGSAGEHPASLPSYRDVAELVLASLDSDTVHSSTMTIHDRILSTVVTPIHEDTDVLCGAVVLIRDITETERLEQTRRDYVANVSHELRTPLASIRSLADALNDEIITDEADRKRYYGYILRESIRLSHLIDDLLELSRLQSGGVAFSKMRVELFEIAYDVADRMNEAAQQRGGSVSLLVPEGEYYAKTNSDRVEQVLVALTDNAIKHGTEGCRVDIGLTLDEAANRYIFSVSNPAEIDPADLDHIFERFYKADRAHTGEGTGLGLAIVSEVLNLLGEKITVDYKDGVIRFDFTVERDGRDGEHPELVPGEKADYPLLPSAESDVLQ